MHPKGPVHLTDSERFLCGSFGIRKILGIRDLGQQNFQGSTQDLFRIPKINSRTFRTRQIHPGPFSDRSCASVGFRKIPLWIFRNPKDLGNPRPRATKLQGIHTGSFSDSKHQFKNFQNPALNAEVGMLDFSDLK